MSDHLPIVEVPESTWLRALAHALDPEADSPDESLAPDDDPVAGSSDELDVGDGSDDSADSHDGDAGDGDTSLGADDVEPAVWDTDDSWSPSGDVAGGDPHDGPLHDDGIG